MAKYLPRKWRQTNVERRPTYDELRAKLHNVRWSDFFGKRVKKGRHFYWAYMGWWLGRPSIWIESENKRLTLRFVEAPNAALWIHPKNGRRKLERERLRIAGVIIPADRLVLGAEPELTVLGIDEHVS